MRKSPQFSPTQLAAFVSIVFLLISVLYIWLSGLIIYQISAHDLELYHRWEIVKGIGYVTLASLCLYFLIKAGFKSVQEQHEHEKMQEQLVLEAQRRALEGVFASSLFHDINNLLFILDMSIRSVEGGAKDGDRESGLQRIRECHQRLESLAHRFSYMKSFNNEEVLERVDLREVCQEAVAFAGLHQRVKNTHLRINTGPEKIPIIGNVTILNQIILNLILNAAEEMGGEGEILLTCYVVEGDALLQIHDSGKGIKGELKEKIFEPFFSTKEEGHGLGLYSVKLGVERLKGKIEAENSRELGGAVFTITIPLEREAAERTA